MSRWQQLLEKQSKNTSKKPTHIEKECVECGSKVWACYSNDGGRRWWCWGHRPEATDKDREKEELTQREYHEIRKNKKRKIEQAREEIQVKRHGRRFRSEVQVPMGDAHARHGLLKGGKYDWFFD